MRVFAGRTFQVGRRKNVKFNVEIWLVGLRKYLEASAGIVE